MDGNSCYEWSLLQMNCVCGAYGLCFSFQTQIWNPKFVEFHIFPLYSRQDWFKEGNSRGVDWHGTLKYHSITNNSFNLCMTQWIVIKHASFTLNLFFIHDWGYCSTSDLYDPADYDLQSRNVWLKRAIGSFNERNRRKKVSREMANPWLIHPLPGICSNILENVETSFLAY